MRITSCLLFITIVLVGSSRSRAVNQDVLATLRRAHPRLLVLDDDLVRVKQQIATDATARRWFESLQKSAEKIIAEPVSQRVLVGPRLLHVSRRVVDRVLTLAGLYRLTGERRYFERARDEMLAAAAFADWHPEHFLDVAEMTNGMAIGYDWLYAQFSESERATIRSAIVEKGLKPGIQYQSSKRGPHTQTNNWNQVCNGGLTVGALAVADEEPEIARTIIQNMRASIPLAMAKFAPDGGCEEGPGYWSYAISYTAYCISSLQTALGNDLGLLKSPGLAETGMFRIHAAGPIRLGFNFADAGASVGRAAEMFWLARAFDRPVYAAHERMLRDDHNSVDAFHLLWFNPAGDESDIAQLPKAAMFKRINVAFMRSGWNDPAAAYVGFKGGDNNASHAHADLGTFIYDADGVRWALDLGGDDYNLPAYFGNLRYTYYRLRTQGHNTLTIGNENQNTEATAPLLAFSEKPGHAFAVADLTAGYAPHATRVHRGVHLLGRQLLVQDEIKASTPLEIVWNFHTDARPAIDSGGAVATLSAGKKTLMARILEPAGARFDLLSANSPPPQMQQPNVTNLVIRQPQRVTSLRLVVLLWPQSEQAAEVTVSPLAQWIDAAPVGN